MLKTTTTSGEGPEHGTADGELPQALPREREFAAPFGSTPRGARLARRVAVSYLVEWGHPAASDLSATVALLVAELAGNAVRHGWVPGRDFRLRLALDARRVRIEVADASPVHPPTAVRAPAADAVSGRGLVLVGRRGRPLGCGAP